MNTVELTPVESSSLHAVGYDKDAQDLHVQFRPGEATYVYHQVPPETHAELMAAESKGKHFAARIRGAYKHTKIDKK